MSIMVPGTRATMRVVSAHRDGEGEWAGNSTTPTNQPYAVLPACVQSLSDRTMAVDDVHSNHSRGARFSSALHTLSDGRVVPEMPAKTCSWIRNRTLDPAAAVEARRDYRALSKSGSPDGGTQRTN